MKKYKFKTKPFDHQLIALDKSWDKKVYALFMEMGTGKTKVIIDNIGILKQQEIELIETEIKTARNIGSSDIEIKAFKNFLSKLV